MSQILTLVLAKYVSSKIPTTTEGKQVHRFLHRISNMYIEQKENMLSHRFIKMGNIGPAVGNPLAQPETIFNFLFTQWVLIIRQSDKSNRKHTDLFNRSVGSAVAFKTGLMKCQISCQCARTRQQW